jgi:hypothetical protein
MTFAGSRIEGKLKCVQCRQSALATVQYMSAVPTMARGIFVIRFRINELIEECNRTRPAEDRLHMQILADAIGMSRSTLAGLTTLTREPVTNTAAVEAITRFFKRQLPGFEVSMLFEFTPPLEDTTEVRVDRLYPQRTAKGQAYRRRR